MQVAGPKNLRILRFQNKVPIKLARYLEKEIRANPVRAGGAKPRDLV